MLTSLKTTIAKLPSINRNLWKPLLIFWEVSDWFPIIESKHIKLDKWHNATKFLAHVLVFSVQFSSVQFSLTVVSDSLWPHELHHARPLCPLPTPRVYSDSCLLNQWSNPTISSSVVPFSSCLQSFPAWGSFQMTQFFASGGWIIGVSALASVLPVNIQDWFPLGWTAWISLQSKGLARVFSNTTVQRHQFFTALFIV